jgi:hypothetical protein
VSQLRTPSRGVCAWWGRAAGPWRSTPARTAGSPRTRRRVRREQRVPDAQLSGVVQADDVARDGLVDDRALGGHERVGLRRRSGRAGAGERGVHAALEVARHHPQERDAVAVTRVHVRLDLEHEPRELGSCSAHGCRPWSGGARGRRQRHQRSSTGRTPKFVIAEPKKNGVTSPARNSSIDQVSPAISSSSIRLFERAVRAVDSDSLAQAGSVEVHGLLREHRCRRPPPNSVDVTLRDSRSMTPRNSVPIADRPVQGHGADLERLADGVHQVDRARGRGGPSCSRTSCTGSLRRRQTSNSCSVRGSTPLAASTSMTAESTAASTR